MNLAELANSINTALQHERNPENIEVVITTTLPYVTCGQCPCTDVKHTGMGFDWEAGQFRIEPKEKLMEVKRDVPQEAIEWRENYHCPKCERMLSKKRKDPSIRFCSSCGTAIKWE